MKLENKKAFLYCLINCCDTFTFLEKQHLKDSIQNKEEDRIDKAIDFLKDFNAELRKDMGNEKQAKYVLKSMEFLSILAGKAKTPCNDPFL